MLQQALRTFPGGAPVSVPLPDKLTEPVGASGTLLQPTYRLQADLGPAPGRTALYLPGLFAHARVRVNGHVVADRIREPLPRHHAAPTGCCSCRSRASSCAPG